MCGPQAHRLERSLFSTDSPVSHLLSICEMRSHWLPVSVGVAPQPGATDLLTLVDKGHEQRENK